MGLKRWSIWTVCCCVLILWCASTYAQRIPDIKNTKHNFSAAFANVDIPMEIGTSQAEKKRVVSATSEQQICVFCHTPHAAETTVGPLWNRALSSGPYDTYTSGSLDAKPQGVPLDQPNGVSKLCLSCHDGTMAIGAVNVLNGSFTDRNPNTQDIAMTGTSANGRMPLGEGQQTGFTRYLGTNLTNDHPISVVFDANLALVDGDMRSPNNPAETQIVVRGGSRRPGMDDIHLEPTTQTNSGGLVQCNSCHDPHIRETTGENIKFLRLNRLQKKQPQGTGFSKQNDIICLACHNKEGWVGSAHANEAVANEIYTDAAAAVREFPAGTQVWETACLACHDTHSVEGSRRLIREGTDSALIVPPSAAPASTYRIKAGGGAPAQEEGCFACHGPDRGTLQGQGGANFEVPNTYDDFNDPGNTHMPIRSRDQPARLEVHNIGSNNSAVPNFRGKDFVENPQLLGLGDLRNRHAECTDCHNPHRVIKNQHFNDDPNTPAIAGTHDHSAPHTNIASGVLKGTWGVEPQYGSSTFGSNPISFSMKRGNPGIGVDTAVTNSYLTREYQVCFKCHSNHAFGDTPPPLGSFSGGTAEGTNGLQNYTNIAMEFQSPNSHQGEGTKPNSGAASQFATNNHRAWHPVMNNTGRTAGVRNANPNNWIAPFVGAVGTQTMYCTDCHGSATAAGTAIPTGGENGAPWGPHGSTENFILKGPWSGDRTTGTGEGQPTHLCFRCHQYNQYANPATATIQNSGFQLGAGNMCMMGGGGGAAGGGMGGGMGGGAAGGGGMMCMAMGGGGIGGGGMGGGMGDGMMGGMNNLHIFHANAVNNFRCNLCHVAIPHGWKNKNFLVNLNDAGPEGGLGASHEVRFTTATFTGGGYYNRAALKIFSFAQSGTWSPANCGSVSPPPNGTTGVAWMASGSQACVDVP